MSTGPIEFLGEGEPHEVPATEYGGADGLIQPSPEEVDLIAADGMAIGHDVTASEAAAVAGRRARVPLNVVEARDGVSETGDIVEDPATGRVLKDEEIGADVTGKPGSEHGLRDLILGE